MANEDRTPADAVDLLSRLQREPFRFDFYQALRRLECAYSQHPRCGQALRPGEEPVRLTQDPSLAFPPSTLTSFRPGKDGRPVRLSVAFLGMFGPNGPLPLHLTEYARDRLRNFDDPTFTRFIDIFHHRMLSLFYRSWASGEPTVQFDRPQNDRFALYVGAIAGLGMPSLRNRDEMPDWGKFFFSGFLSCPTRHPDGLMAMLNTFFQLPIRIEEFVGHWIRIPDDSRTCLGLQRGGHALARTAMVGERAWDCQQKFRIHVGPIGLSDYLRLLPGGSSLKKLDAIVRNYVGFELNWEMRLILKKSEVPKLGLGRSGHLGWTTWVASQPFGEDADQLVLDPQRPRRVG